jgi:hypothetical protein
MMFVSVMSTSAFAATYDTTDQRTWAGAGQQKKIVDALRTNIESIYGSYAVDNAVFNSIKTIDGILKDLVDGALNDYATSSFNRGGLTSSSTLNDAIVAGLRSTIGGEISDYLNKHYNEYYTYDSAGHRVFNPSAYAGVYAKAASGALTSEKAVAGIQAYMLYAMQRSAFNSVANMANDLRNEINGWDHWGDYGFGDMEKGIHGWNVPGVDLDGVLHNIDPNYASVLSAMGQLGVNLDQSTEKRYDWVEYDPATGKVIDSTKTYNPYKVTLNSGTNNYGTIVITNDDGTKVTKNVKLVNGGEVPSFGLGYEGWITSVDGTLELSKAATNERVNSALIDTYYVDKVTTQGGWDFSSWWPKWVDGVTTFEEVAKEKADYIVNAYEQVGNTLNEPNDTIDGITFGDNVPGYDSFNWAKYDYNNGSPIVQDTTRDSYSNDMWTGYWY